MIGRLIHENGEGPTSFASAWVKRKKRRYWYCLRVIFGVRDDERLRGLSSRSDRPPRRPIGVPA